MIRKTQLLNASRKAKNSMFGHVLCYSRPTVTSTVSMYYDFLTKTFVVLL